MSAAPLARRISIHALLAESDLCPICQWRRSLKFLSTLSLRRATPPRHWHGGKPGHFYPRSPCGERHVPQQPCVVKSQFLSTLSLRRATWCMSRKTPVQAAISIHALLAESDGGDCYGFGFPVRFLSTLSLRRATRCHCLSRAVWIISIHALLAESDDDILAGVNELLISIHALLAESDALTTLGVCVVRDFYPRSPCGERQRSGSQQPDGTTNFYPRSPCGERQRLEVYKRHYLAISIHALLAESDGQTFACWYIKEIFLSTLSLRRATVFCR